MAWSQSRILGTTPDIVHSKPEREQGKDSNNESSYSPRIPLFLRCLNLLPRRQLRERGLEVRHYYLSIRTRRV